MRSCSKPINLLRLLPCRWVKLWDLRDTLRKPVPSVYSNRLIGKKLEQCLDYPIVIQDSSSCLKTVPCSMRQFAKVFVFWRSQYKTISLHNIPDRDFCLICGFWGRLINTRDTAWSVRKHCNVSIACKWPPEKLGVIFYLPYKRGETAKLIIDRRTGKLAWKTFGDM